jgi:hypothetical protein
VVSPASSAVPISFVAGDVDLLLKIQASVTDKSFYGLNITNSVVLNNTGNGIQAMNVRDRTALCNVSVEGNQGIAGMLVRDGAADIWINDTSLSYNWGEWSENARLYPDLSQSPISGDGMNVSFAGGSVNLNTSRLVANRWRGFALHYNSSTPFYSPNMEVVIKGRPANNLFYPKMLIADNLWGGVLIGNVCVPASRGMEPKVLVNWVEFNNNHYHPALEIFSCQRRDWRTDQVNVQIVGDSECITTNLFIPGTRIPRLEPANGSDPGGHQRQQLPPRHWHGPEDGTLRQRSRRHQLQPLPQPPELCTTHPQRQAPPTMASGSASDYCQERYQGQHGAVHREHRAQRGRTQAAAGVQPAERAEREHGDQSVPLPQAQVDSLCGTGGLFF